MPDWLVQVIIQYPIVVIVGFVAWYSYRELKRQTRQFQERESMSRAQAEARFDKLQKELIKSKDKMADRFEALLRTEVKHLAKALEELTKRLGG
jgi:hypothetical protein